MSWYTQADREELNRNRAQQNISGRVPFQMKRIRVQDSTPSELTVIVQMYVAPFFSCVTSK